MLTKGDKLILIFSMVLVAGVVAFMWHGPASKGQFVHIVQGENQPQKLSLFQNRIIKVAGKLGETTIEISGGRVRFTDSPCSSKLCVHQGWLDFSGDIIACLPNQVSASITGQDSRFDSINF